MVTRAMRMRNVMENSVAFFFVCGYLSWIHRILNSFHVVSTIIDSISYRITCIFLSILLIIPYLHTLSTYLTYIINSEKKKLLIKFILSK